MTTKNIILIVVAGVIVLGAGILLTNQPNLPQNNTSDILTYNPKTQGKIVFGVTDAASNMGGVSSVLVTINKVEVRSVATNDWVTVSNETKQYDLLALKTAGAVSLIANINADVGVYDQAKLVISKVLIVKNGIEQEAKLPSGELKTFVNIVVNADQTSSIVFDFIADKSLHVTGNGKFIFAPVIKVKKQKDVKIELKSNNEVDIKNGKEEEDEDIGMDSKGEVKKDFELKGNLRIDENDDIQGEDGRDNND